MTHAIRIVSMCIALWLGACLQSPAVTCADGSVCPSGTACIAASGVTLCATALELGACSGKLEGDACTLTAGTGVCRTSVCVLPRCGNARREPPEACDDGNTESGDGCAATCASTEVCGNGIVDRATGEDCDDGNAADDDLCRRDCTVPRCGDGIIDANNGEACDLGLANANTPNAACRNNCQAQRCGDGVVDLGEICDDGNLASGDGCSGDCKSNETCGNGYVDIAKNEACDDGNRMDNDSCRNTCLIPNCGDGVVNVAAGEACDAGAMNSNAPNAICRVNCQPQRCSDGIVDTGEVCDDGDLASGDGCSGDCKSNETCGNGYADAGKGEHCDDGNRSDGDGCRNDCTVPRCGDGIIDAASGEGCDAGTSNSNAPNAACRSNCQVRRCGDHVLDSGEVCDDGDLDSGDGCSGDCQSTEACGNGYVDVATGEQCDDGNRVDRDGCQGNCQAPRCGDGIVDESNGEACDAGTSNSNAPNAACRANCQPQRCGDGVRDVSEVCDDGNLQSGDGCSGDCRSTEFCGNGYLDALVGEQCDDGAYASGDGCSSRCRVEIARWETEAVAPPARLYAAFGYLPISKEQVLFGGADDIQRDSTHTGAGGGFRELEIEGPAARMGAALAATPDGRALVLFGGESPDRFWDDTWRWTGARWDTITATGPSGRWGHAMVTTPQGILLVGGHVTGVAAPGSNEAWLYTNAAWTQISGATPPARALAGLAYDEARQVAVLFGGRRNLDDNVGLADTWEWDGTSWRNVSDGSAPATQAALFFDYGAREVLRLSYPGRTIAAWRGGQWVTLPVTLPANLGTEQLRVAYDSLLGGTLVYDGTLIYVWRSGAFEEVAINEQALASVGAAVAYDALRGEAIVFGGRPGDNTEGHEFDPGNKMFRLRAGRWQRYVGAVPSARVAHAMAYDVRRQRVVLFGGEANGTRNHELWEWNGSSWQQRPAAGLWPTARSQHTLTYDPIRQVSVLYGGEVSSGPSYAYDDTVWEWDGTIWQAHTAGGPSGRAYHAATYSVRHGGVVVSGGYDGGPMLGDLWLWRDQQWSLLATNAPPRGQHQLVYHPLAQRLFLIGGNSGSLGGYASNEKSVWSIGVTETEFRREPSLPWNRVGHRAYYDAVANVIASIGGVQGEGVSRFTQGDYRVQVRLRYTNEELREACLDAGADADDDGLLGCADPDCWGRCQPLCPAQTSCTSERCGDGICNQHLEDEFLCPVDCN